MLRRNFGAIIRFQAMQQIGIAFPSMTTSPTKVLPFLVVSLSAIPAKSEDVRAQLEPLLSASCYECHDDVTDKGGLNLLDLEFEPEKPHNFALWQHVFERVESGEMPPKEEPRPDAKLATTFLKNLEEPLVETDLARKAEEGRVLTRRLTRREYEHTIHDLLGVDIPLQNLLPEDGETNHFETVASGQQISHFNLARYLETADLALAEAFDRVYEEEETFSKNYGIDQLGEKTRGRGNYRGPQNRNNEVAVWPLRLQFYGRMPATRVPESGRYRVTLKNVRAINPKAGSVWGTLSSGECSSDAPVLSLIGLVEATREKRDIVYEAWIQEDHMLEMKPADYTRPQPKNLTKGGNVIYNKRNPADEGHEGIAFSGIQIERIFPNGNRSDVRKNLFGDIDDENLKAIRWSKSLHRKRLESVVRHFAGRAFRRPVTDEQVVPYLELAIAEAENQPRPNIAAVKAAYRAILCSPRFLTFIESPGRLDDHALASRLSYMLWNSMPDRELRSLADQGKLSDYKVRHAQANRLLDDPKADRFIASFTDQWLKLKEIDFTAPDQRLYRTFDPIVQESMLQETRQFVKRLLVGNYNVTNLIDSDFGMLNERLERFYGYENVAVKPGEGLQKVSLAEDQRSGLVAQGAILKVTADGTTTSPVVRGVWVGERILGLHIPPPPPGVPAVEPDIRGAVSIRDQLAKHSNDKSCAACHEKIDPAGFALETFDPVGLPRKKYGTKKDSAVVDPSGVTPGGEKFADFAGWQKIYRNKPEMLAENFARQLLTYATGAPPSFSDRADVEKIVGNVAEKDYGMKSIIHGVVASNAFRNK